MKKLDFLAFLESMTESVIVTDTQLELPGPHIVYVNQSFTEMTGWSREEVIGQSPRILQGPKTNMAIFANLQEKLKKGKAWKGRTINYRKNGTEFHMEWSITPIFDDSGQIYQFLAVQKDITELVLTEIQLERAKKLDAERVQLIEETNNKLSKLIKEQEKTLSLFIKFVPAPIIERALEGDALATTFGKRLECGLLFCDIRGFTSIAEKLEPGEVVSLLNMYYSEMAAVIDQHNGEINQFVGDEIFASFGAPLPIIDPECSAVCCALAMIDALGKLNGKIKLEFNAEINIGIGIHYGSVIVGNLGSEKRLSYSITGSHVITAKRIESLTRQSPNSIYISEAIHKAVENKVHTHPLGRIDIKGREDKINVYQVLSLKE